MHFGYNKDNDLCTKPFKYCRSACASRMSGVENQTPTALALFNMENSFFLGGGGCLK